MASPEVARVLLVGCGNIAGGFDADRDRADPPVTHAGALTRHAGFAVRACVDPDAAKRIAFANHWGIERHADSVAALSPHPGEYDLVCICSPTHLHSAGLEDAIALRPRLIVCEKPVTPTLAETRHWVERLRTAGILLAVNHTRRWDPAVIRLRTELKAGRWGIVRAVTGHYNKGILNNGAHMIDLVSMLIGAVRPICAGKPVWDYWQNDPSVPAMLETESGIPVHLNVGHASDCALFELQLVTSHAVISMENGGHLWRTRPIVNSGVFKGYRSLADGEASVGEYAFAMSHAIKNFHDALRYGAAVACTGEMAASAQSVCEAIRAMSMSESIGNTA